MTAATGHLDGRKPEHLIHWIQDPPSINHKTAMPNLHVTDQDARDIATYLYTLR